MILITGGAGYIGSHAARILLDRGYKIIIIDNLATGHIEAVDKRALFYKQDLSDIEALRKIFLKENITAVLHFAGYSQVGESMKEPYKYYMNNVEITNVLLQVMSEFDCKKIVFSSSASVYGKTTKNPITEDCELAPTSVYGETKVTIEKMLKWYDVTKDIKYVALRYFNVAGAISDSSIGEAHNPESHLIPLILKAIIDDKTVKVYGNDYITKDGTCIRDYIHVVDLIEAHILALEYLLKGENSIAINLGNGEGFSVYEIIKHTEDVTSIKVKYVNEKRRDGDPDALVASSKLAFDKLGWTPKFQSIDKIITDAWHWEQNRKY